MCYEKEMEDFFFVKPVLFFLSNEGDIFPFSTTVLLWFYCLRCGGKDYVNNMVTASSLAKAKATKEFKSGLELRS